MMFRSSLFKHPVKLVQYLDWVSLILVCECRVVDAGEIKMCCNEMHAADKFKKKLSFTCIHALRK